MHDPLLIVLSAEEHLEFSSMIREGILALEDLWKQAHDCGQGSNITTVEEFVFEIEVALDYWNL